MYFFFDVIKLWRACIFPIVCSPVLEVMSGDVMNSAGGAGSADVPASQEGQPQHVKHEGYVFLQGPRSDPARQGALLGEHWWLLHSVTHQKVRLPAPVDIWQLTIDNDGFATLYDAGADAELDACDLFKRHLVKQDGELHIMDPTCGNAKLAEALTEAMAKRGAGSIQNSLALFSNAKRNRRSA